MGTQQILLIVLSVIIVGIAVAVGITMFNAQSVNSNRSACISDMNNFATQATAYYKTPVSHGGCGSAVGNVDVEKLINWIGFKTSATTMTTGNGVYTVDHTVAGTILFTAVGNESVNTPGLKVILATGAIETAPTGTF